MSLSFIVKQRDRKKAGSSKAKDIEGDVGKPSSSAAGSAQPTLEQFWTKVNEDMMKTSLVDSKTQAFPLARIKKIMKLDDEVKMISSEAPVLFAKAVEIFIHELTLRAWSHGDNHRGTRRTLQRNDIARAISKSDQYDFLIDIVPRHEFKTKMPRFETVRPHAKPTTSGNARKQQPCLQQSNQQQQLHATFLQTQQPQFVLQNMGQIVQNSNPQTVALVQAVQPYPVSNNPELQNIPRHIKLTQEQLNMVRFQVFNNPNQPITIQTQPQPSPPQIIQVTSQGQHQQQVYISQVQPSQDAS